MANKVIISEQFKLKAIDYIKGFIMAVGTPVLYFVQELIPGWDVDPIVKIALSAGVTYLTKNFFDGPKVTTTYKTNEKAVDVATDIKQGT